MYYQLIYKWGDKMDKKRFILLIYMLMSIIYSHYIIRLVNIQKEDNEDIEYSYLIIVIDSILFPITCIRLYLLSVVTRTLKELNGSLLIKLFLIVIEFPLLFIRIFYREIKIMISEWKLIFVGDEE